MNITQIANNQFSVRTNKGLYFQSYDSVIALIDNNSKITLGIDYRYSRTTMKFLCRFLNIDSIKEIDKLIADKVIKINKNLVIK